MNGNSLFKKATLGFIAVWIMAFAVVPNLLVVEASLLTKDPDGFLKPILSLGSYARLFDPAMVTLLWNSLFLAGGATVICLLVGYPFAYVAARAGKDTGRLLLLFVMIPFWTNSLVRTYALIILLKADGVINKLLLSLGLIDSPLRLMYSKGAVFVGLAYTLLPFMILTLYSAIEKLDHRLIEAARDLGASPIKTFREITIPLTMPGIISGCMLVFIPALGMFYIPDILGGAKVMLLGNFIRDQFLSTRDWPMGSAASIGLALVMCAMLLAYYVSLRRLNRSIEQ